ncbi:MULTISPECIES: META domain-containing protein [unclassified Coleofasciculus]|uniref:META domain-containing protein n=1 Tax=unclassified Coleofasciculus TaxID=2692782 RepID=UPI00187E7D6E|nr:MULTISPECIES: META domain-containing protein [unclassified Coleofasciculus]MBE9126602.1 META domain-containing protein [Coleofasciculus sp. LEGE 07081]MBE9148854.1 META domain-containing protein [Coleofasciculus sp. LEGE 07092]
MFNPLPTSRQWLRLLGLGLPIFIALSLMQTKPAAACRPAPGSSPATIEQRVSQTPYVFEGTVTQVNGDTLTIRVNRYFKGSGPKVVTLTGFNSNSCQNIITEPGERYLFFGENEENGNWSAVYDGAFGSVRPWSPEVLEELKSLGLGQSFSTRAIANLDNQRWLLSSYRGRDVLPNTEITATLADGRMTGSAGCNRYGAFYGMNGKGLIFDRIEFTEMACQQPEGIMEQEQNYLQALQSVTRYRLRRNRLMFFNERGDRILSFTASDEATNR